MQCSRFAFLVLPLLLGAATSKGADGLTLGATRLIYDAAKKEASVPLSNGDNSVPWLVQSWVSNFNRTNTKVPFVTTPPIFKLMQQTNSAVRVVYIGDAQSSLPVDRESVFLLNVRAVPAVKKRANPSRLVIANQNIIKLIYRPGNLTSQEARMAWQKLKLTPGRSNITFSNPTPYVVTLTGMKVNGQAVQRPGVVMPFSSRQIKNAAGAVRSISFSTINDFGGNTPVRTETF